jgi:hypothetical protein
LSDQSDVLGGCHKRALKLKMCSLTLLSG